MKTKYLEKINGQTLVRFISEATPDNEATKVKIAKLITDTMTDKEIENLFEKNLIYAKVGDEAELINDQTAAQIQKKLDGMSKNQQLLNNGEYIADYRGVEYWIKKSGSWKQEKIEELGLNLPKGSVLQEDLSKEQQDEIFLQKDAERIAALSVEEKEEEKKAKLYALARVANQKAEDAELLGEVFDKTAWLQPQKVELEQLYA